MIPAGFSKSCGEILFLPVMPNPALLPPLNKNQETLHANGDLIYWRAGRLPVVQSYIPDTVSLKLCPFSQTAPDWNIEFPIHLLHRLSFTLIKVHFRATCPVNNGTALPPPLPRKLTTRWNNLNGEWLAGEGPTQYPLPVCAHLLCLTVAPALSLGNPAAETQAAKMKRKNVVL